MIRNKNLFQVDHGLIQFKYNLRINKGSFVIKVLDFRWIKTEKWRYLISELSKRNEGPECRGNIELLKVQWMEPIWNLYHKQRKNLCKLVEKHSGQKEVNNHLKDYVKVLEKAFSGGKNWMISKMRYIRCQETYRWSENQWNSNWITRWKNNWDNKQEAV